MSKQETSAPVIDILAETHRTALGPDVVFNLDEGVTPKKFSPDHRNSIAGKVAEYVVAEENGGSGEAGFATLGTAFVASTGLPVGIDGIPPVHSLKNRSPNSKYSIWLRVSNLAKNIAHATGEPYYLSGDYRQAGLIVPFEGVPRGTVVFEIRKEVGSSKGYYTSLIIGGIKRNGRKVADIKNKDELVLEKVDVCLESRPLGSFKPNDFVSESQRPPSIGTIEVRKNLDYLRNAQKQVPSLYNRDWHNYGSEEKLDIYLSSLRNAVDSFYPNGISLCLDPPLTIEPSISDWA